MRAINSGRRVKRPIKYYSNNLWRAIDKMLYHNSMERPTTDRIIAYASNKTGMKVKVDNNSENHLLNTIVFPPFTKIL